MLRPLLAAMLLASPLPALAQGQSPSFVFLEAVRKSDAKAIDTILTKPGVRIINTQDVTTGESALHIVVKRGDAVYLRYLLQQGADPNLKDGKGNTPMLLAVTLGQAGLVDILIAGKADLNAANPSGETPLIRAVQRRDLSMVRQLLTAGADPDQRDNLAGQSARDYARIDTRAPAIGRLIEETPKKVRKAVAGPQL